MICKAIHKKGKYYNILRVSAQFKNIYDDIICLAENYYYDNGIS